VGSNVAGIALNGTSVRLAVDYKTQNAATAFSKYVGTAKSRIKNSGAAQNGIETGSSPWIDTEAAHRYSNGLTYYRSQFFGTNVAFATGIFHVTYYVWFKGQRTDT